MPNKEALKLPDPLLVRLYTEDMLDRIERVTEDQATRNIEILIAGEIEPRRYLHLQDLGWVPDPDQT